MPGVLGGPVVTMLVCFLLFAREAAGASCARHSLRPLSWANVLHNSGVFTRRDRGGVCGHLRATSFGTLQRHRRPSSLPHLWGGWAAEGRSVGAVRESASSRRPHPGLRFAAADPPHYRGGGIRKSDLSPQAGRGKNG